MLCNITSFWKRLTSVRGENNNLIVEDLLVNWPPDDAAVPEKNASQMNRLIDRALIATADAAIHYPWVCILFFYLLPLSRPMASASCVLSITR